MEIAICLECRIDNKNMQEYEIRPDDSCGVKLTGFNIATSTKDDAVDIKRILADYGVIFFRETGDVMPDDQVRFARQLGSIDYNRFFEVHDKCPEIAVLRTRERQHSVIGEFFHADHTYDLEPAMGSLLVPKKLPLTGGQTMFVDMAKAYESLPERLKSRIANLRAVHSSRAAFSSPKNDSGTGKALFNNSSKATQDHIHPMVTLHPVSKKKVLFINPSFTMHIEGLTPSESYPLLKELYIHALSPEHTVCFEWNLNSAVLWDNRYVWHCAMNNYQGQERLMHRITIKGCRIQGLAEHVHSEPYNGRIHEVLKPGFGKSKMDLPYVKLLLSSVQKGAHTIGGMDPWWPTPSWYEIALLRVLTAVGLDSML